MIYLKVIKKTGAIVALAVLAACSSTSPVIKSTADDPATATTPQQEVTEPTSWQQAYGKQQEAKPNTLSPIKTKLETDVWQRVRGGFAMTSALPLNKPTQQKLDRFLKNRQF